MNDEVMKLADFRMRQGARRSGHFDLGPSLTYSFVLKRN